MSKPLSAAAAAAALQKHFLQVVNFTWRIENLEEYFLGQNIFRSKIAYKFLNVEMSFEIMYSLKIEIHNKISFRYIWLQLIMVHFLK